MSDGNRKRQLRSALFKILRTGFRAFPMSIATRDALRERFLTRFPSIRPLPQQGQPSQTLERRPRVHSAERAIGYVERRDEPLPDPLPATLVAFYLPQFHTIPENDAWWGKGFTEWRNVARALPQFEGHAQPRLPGDLGFYDLRNPQVLRDQAELAQSYGIGAFCMYFYWFGGRTLLELPHQQWLNDSTITLPICLCWANEDWTRTWDGRAGEILISQQHSHEDDLAFIAHIARYLRDPRYLRIDGKPLLLVYRPGKLPDPNATAARWRNWCRDNGIGEIHLAYVQSFERPDPRDIGFDSAVEFPPNLSTATSITSQQRLLNPDYAGEVLDWRDVARDFASRPMPDYPLFPGVNCGWDNEPRRSGRGRTYLYSSPYGYRDWLRRTVHERLADYSPSQRYVFVNAWNEWAEGAALEPDTSLGLALLTSGREALAAARSSTTSEVLQKRPCVIIHAWYLDILEELLVALAQTDLDWHVVITTDDDRKPAIMSVLSKHGLDASIQVVENRGRDVLPFLLAANILRNEGFDVALKLHTKRSPHIANGRQWRQELLSTLVSDNRAQRIIGAFANDATVGLVAPDGHLIETSSFIGANEAGIQQASRLIGLSPEDVKQSVFASGSMFWVRLSAIDAILAAHLNPSTFETEAGQRDGTLAHAIERVIVASVKTAGYRAITAAEACGDPVTQRRHYAYATKG